MKILLISDNEENMLWGNWSQAAAEKLSDIGLILSAGDLQPTYLEFLVTMLNVPLVYVRGNHDGRYDKEPPEGCIDADGKVVTAVCGRRGEEETVRILGLGGSMRYKEGPDMYTEKEMQARIKKAEKELRKKMLGDKLLSGFRGKPAGSRVSGGAENADDAGGRTESPAFDILLTHAPCRGYGDMEDLPHRGFECFNDLLKKYSPKLHCYGHVHKEYGSLKRHIEHPSGTLLINGSGHIIIDFGKL